MGRKMKILFIGAVEFSYKTLQKLVELKTNIVGVCTKKESNFNSDFYDLSKICEGDGIPYKYVKDINSKENIEWIKNLKPDIIFCFGWSNLIKKEILSIPSLGVIGYHPAALPQNRGRHPLIWTLALGLEKSASTFFFMDEDADSGDILSQKEFNIDYKDDARSLYNKVTNLALEQIEEFLAQLQNNTFKKIKQDELKANYWRKRNKEDGKIDFRMSRRAIYNLVRALTHPYIGAHLIYKGEEIKVWRVKEEKCNLKNIEPGKVLDIQDNKILVKTYDNAIWLIDHEFNEIPKVGEYL
jgi:methionyl-tRNA formyltransferase